MKKLLFLDIETTGLSSNSLVWQVAYAKAVQEDAKLKVLEVVEFVGEECIMSEEVRQALEWADVLVAHNIGFVLSFLDRRKLPFPLDLQRLYCTMSKATSVCKMEIVCDWDLEGNHVWYKYPKLEEAIAILGLEDQLGSMVRGLTRNDALYDVHAVMLLYCKLNDLQLQMDGCKIRTADLGRKYTAVKKYAVVNKERLLQSVFTKLMERLLGMPNFL